MIFSFEPIFDKNSRVLILGSMASVKSLEKGFYYMHPQNKFWKTISKVVGKNVPEDIDGKKKWLLENHIALMDIIYGCERKGSLDSDIKNIQPNDISKVLDTADIRAIFCNGKKSLSVAMKTYPDKEFFYLPSSSPANAAAWNEEEWMKIRKYLFDD